MSTYHLDFETSSSADIRLGHYRYAQDPSTRILLCALAKDDGPVWVWDATREDTDGENIGARDIMGEMGIDDDARIYAHNAPFEIAIAEARWKHTFGVPPPPLEHWRCTAAMCRRAAIPFSLQGAGEFLGLGDKSKEKAGKRLVSLFSKGGKSPEQVVVEGKRMKREEAWDMFREYCRQDVEAEREIHRRLAPSFGLTGDALESFLFDLRMNHLGVAVDVQALRNASAVVREFEARHEEEFRELTGLNVTQTMKLLEWLQERGYGGDDLRAATMDEWMGDPRGMTPEALRALRLRSGSSFAAVKKIDSMLDCVCESGRVRGAFLWHGALRTGRWAGRLVQFQNVKKPAIRETDDCYALIRAGGGVDALACLWDQPLEALASVVRNFVREPDADYIDLDFSNIEGRVVGWLAGDEDLTGMFAAGVDVYKVTAAAIYGVEVDDVTPAQRALGKVTCLAANYGMGWPRFVLTASAQGLKVDDALARRTIYTYRKARAPIVSLWRTVGEAAVSAVRAPGEFFQCSAIDRTGFRYGRTGGFPALLMTLPSGRKLCYPHARVVVKEVTAEVLIERDGEIVTETRVFPAESIRFHGPRQGAAGWGDVDTHGSKLVENMTQATAGDFLVHGLLAAQKEGFEVPAVIHDQALAIHRPEKDLTLERFLRCMTRVPAWAPGFPLKAEANIVPCYSK